MKSKHMYTHKVCALTLSNFVGNIPELNKIQVPEVPGDAWKSTLFMSNDSNTKELTQSLSKSQSHYTKWKKPNGEQTYVQLNSWKNSRKFKPVVIQSKSLGTTDMGMGMERKGSWWWSVRKPLHRTQLDFGSKDEKSYKLKSGMI